MSEVLEQEKKEALLEISERHVDIEAAIRKKNPKGARKIPRFVFNYLRRVTHEAYVNEVLYKWRHQEGLEFLKTVLIDEFGVKIKAKNLDKVPLNEKAIVIANHPLGGIDGMALLHMLGQKRPDIAFPVNDILMGVPHLHSLFVPINKSRKKGSQENIDRMNQLFCY